MKQNKLQTFIKQLDPQKTKLNEPLAPYTTLKIGGPADILYTAHTTNELISVIKLAKYNLIPVTILGRGSNVLISDKGIRGLVIINQTKTIQIKGEKPISEDRTNTASLQARWESDTTSGTFRGIEFKDLDYDESDKPRVEVVIDSGVDLAFAINYLINQGITGFQWYAGIPGTIGGAVFNNIHGGTHFISEVTKNVKVLTKDLAIKELKPSDLGVDYDKSRFHESGEVILQTTFNLYKGDAEKAKYMTLEWAKRKSIQPRNSPGSAFTNITQQEREKFGYPTTATGYIIEHVLKMSEFKIGDAAISKAHHNFIVNEGHASAAEYLAVMKEIHKRIKEKLKINVIPEIILLGFEKAEIEELYK